MTLCSWQDIKIQLLTNCSSKPRGGSVTKCNILWHWPVTLTVGPFFACTPTQKCDRVVSSVRPAGWSWELCDFLGHSVATQFSPSTDWVMRGTWGMIQRRSSSSLSCGRPSWAVLAWAGTSTVLHCLSNVSTADCIITHLPRCPEGWFWTGCYNVTCLNNTSSGPLPTEEFPVGPFLDIMNVIKV